MRRVPRRIRTCQEVNAVADSVSRSAARTATIAALPVALLVGVLAFWLLGGFGGRTTVRPSASPSAMATGPVPVSAPPLSGATILTCRAFIAQLPDRIRNLPRRPVSAGVEQNAAYGDPPIVVSCGAPAPSVAPTAYVWPLSQVCWYEAKAGSATVWTTVDRRVPVTVTVPATYDSPGQWVAEFGDTVASVVPSSASAPTGCGR
jgi:Protein of unknown function (DUF3515)